MALVYSLAKKRLIIDNLIVEYTYASLHGTPDVNHDMHFSITIER